MLELCYSPGSSSLIPHIALREIGLKFNLKRIDLSAGEQHGEWFSRINRRRMVPVLRTRQGSVTECAGILAYIANLAVDDQLFPAPDTIDHVRYIEAIAHLSSTIQMNVAQIYRPERFGVDPSSAAQIRECGRSRLRLRCDDVEYSLGASDWLVGRFTPADIYLFVFFRWVRRAGIKCDKYYNWTDHARRMLDRTPVVQSLQREGLDRKDWIE